jgi:hypothetical protein
MGLNDEREKLRQAQEWLKDCKPTSHQFQAAWEHINDLLCCASDVFLHDEARETADETLRRYLVGIEWVGWRALGRGGNGQNGDGTWSETDGRGCPVCGQIRGGGHGGGCPNTQRYDEGGNVIA